MPALRNGASPRASPTSWCLRASTVWWCCRFAEWIENAQMDWMQQLTAAWHYLVLALSLLVFGSAHAILYSRIGFTGGMNIRVRHWLEKRPSHPVRDLQFRIEGPVVAHLQEVSADDWFFTTREALRGETWFPHLASSGTVIARGTADGPDEDYGNLRWTILAALVAARSVRIVTPYFLPEPTIVAALNLATLRGVEVEIMLPGQSNLPSVQWASTAQCR